LLTKLPTMQNNHTRVFLVDDDEVYLQAMRHSLVGEKNLPLSIRTFTTGEECLKQMQPPPSIVVLDYYLNSRIPGAENGINILRKIKQHAPDADVIMLSSQDDVNIAIQSLENGAFDYVSKSESAFIKIRNIVINRRKHYEVTLALKKEASIYKKTSFLVVLILVVLFILSRIFK
jgi:two-component system, OmpR family, response regulator